jgi:hypothetical protein
MIWEAHCHLAAYPQTATLPLSCVQGSEETPNECALLTWAWPCQSLKPMQTLESLLQAFLQGVHMNTDNVCRKCPTPLSTLDVCSLKTAPLHTLILPRLANPVLDQAVYHKPCLLGPLYAVSPPLCSTLCIINLLHFFYPRAQTTQFQLSVCCPSVFSPFHCFPYSSPTSWRTIAKTQQL